MKIKKLNNEIKVGTVVEGTVENIMPYGAFVDIGDGISGLVHISQLSQKRVKSPEDVVKEGEQVTVKLKILIMMIVLNFDV